MFKNHFFIFIIINLFRFLCNLSKIKFKKPKNKNIEKNLHTKNTLVYFKRKSTYVLGFI